MKDLNNILMYLKMNKRDSFHKRTKKALKERTSETSSLDSHLSKLSREGYIRQYFHPSIGFIWDNLKIEPDQKIFYSLTDSGVKFLKRGGYH